MRPPLGHLRVDDVARAVGEGQGVCGVVAVGDGDGGDVDEGGVLRVGPEGDFGVGRPGGGGSRGRGGGRVGGTLAHGELGMRLLARLTVAR